MIYTISGELRDGELLEYVTAEFAAAQKELPECYLYDFRQCIWNTESLDSFKRNVMTASQLESPAHYGAMVFSRPEDYGLGKMIENMVKMGEAGADAEAFLNYDEALAWLIERRQYPPK